MGFGAPHETMAWIPSEGAILEVVPPIKNA